MNKYLKPWLLAAALILALVLATWLGLNLLLFPRLALQLATRMGTYIGRPVSIKILRYRPPFTIVLGNVAIEGLGHANKVKIKLHKIPATSELAALGTELRTLTDNQWHKALARPSDLIKRLLQRAVLPRSLSIEQLDFGQWSGSLSFRSGKSQLNLDAVLKRPFSGAMQLAYTVQTGLTELELQLDTKEGTRLPLAFLPESSKIGLDLQATQSQNQPWQLSGVLRGLHEQLTATYCFKAELDPLVALEFPVYGEQANTEKISAQGELLFTGGIFSSGDLSFTILPRLSGLFASAVAAESASPLPAWVELDIVLEQQPLHSVLSLLPPPLLGRLIEASYTGELDLKAVINIPVYDIASASLSAEHSLSGFRLASLPGFERLFLLDEAFSHCIEDDYHNRLLPLQVPAFRQPSLDWLLLHSERGRGWLLAQDAARVQARAAHQGWLHHTSRASQNGNAAESCDSNDSIRPYSRVDEISPYLVSAVLTAEDGDFFFHPGIDWKNLAAATARNLAAGGFDYGASTISMQLVKNLFLGSEKTLARKVQEALLVYVMEEQLRIPKARILELYLNIAEFGPGIYGAEQAARYYFAVPASALTLGQSLWLASILPSPKRFHSYYDAGAISPGWFIRMRSILDVMLERGRISQEEHAQATLEPPLFVFRQVLP